MIGHSRFLPLDSLRYTKMDSAESFSHNTDVADRAVRHYRVILILDLPHMLPLIVVAGAHITWLKTETEVCIAHFSTVR
jgi:hypothetical protein